MHDVVEGSRYSYRRCDGSEKSSAPANFRGVVEVEPTAPKDSKVTWSGWFDSKAGSKEEVEALFKLFIDSAMERCRTMTGG